MLDAVCFRNRHGTVQMIAHDCVVIPFRYAIVTETSSAHTPVTLFDTRSVAVGQCVCLSPCGG